MTDRNMAFRPKTSGKSGFTEAATVDFQLGYPLLPPEHRFLVELAVRLMFPCLIFGITFVQNPALRSESFVLELTTVLGQMLMWLAALAAVEIVLVLDRGRWSLWFSLALIVGSRLVRIPLSSGPEIEVIYNLGMCGLFGLAAVALVQHRSHVLERQFQLFVAISVPLMLLQLLGYPEIVYILRTDIHTVLPIQFTLFQDDPLIVYDTIQARPAGFVYASNVLSLVLLLILAVQLGSWTEGGRVSADAWLAAIITLAMSKLVFLSIIVLTCINVFVSPWWYRKRLIRLWLLIGVMLLGYYFLFPRVFQFNTSSASFLVNFVQRFEGLRAVWLGLEMAEFTVTYTDGAPAYGYSIIPGSQSTYAKFARWLPVLSVGLFLGFPIYRRRWLGLARRRPNLGRISMNGVAVVALVPIYGSMIFGPIFWMMIGIGALPLVVRQGIASTPAQ